MKTVGEGIVSRKYLVMMGKPGKGRSFSLKWLNKNKQQVGIGSNEIDEVVIIPGRVKVDKSRGHIPTNHVSLDQWGEEDKMSHISQLIKKRKEAMQNKDFHQVSKLTFKINALMGSLTIKKEFYEASRNAMVDLSNYRYDIQHMPNR